MTGLSYYNTSKRWRKKWRKKWRKYYKKRYGTGRTKIINASSRSKCTIKTRVSSGYSVPIPANQNYTPVVCISPWWYKTNTYTGDDAQIVNQILPYSTCGTDNYRYFCTMYDSVKVDGVYARITVQNVVGAGGAIAALNVYTAWDRQMNLDDLKADVYPSFNKLRTLPSATCSIVSNNTGSTIYRYCKASSFMEKYCYLDSTQRDFQFPVYGYNVNLRGDEALKNGGGNWPGFCPALYICFETPHMTPQETFTVYYVVDFVTVYTFKNPYGNGGIAGSAKLEEKGPQYVVTTSKLREAIKRASDLGTVDAVDDGLMDAKRMRIGNSAAIAVAKQIDGPDDTLMTNTTSAPFPVGLDMNLPERPVGVAPALNSGAEDDIVLSELTKMS